MKTKLTRSLIHIALIAAGLSGMAASHAESPIATYSVAITNMTSGQPMTPPVVATHRPATGAFTVGEPASFEVKEIAENGNVGPLADAFAADSHVFESRVVPSPSGPPPILPGATLEFEIMASASTRFLSFVSMLICTNDGFTGIDTLLLPIQVGESVTAHTAGYDAGTEINTEDYADIVPPCQGLVGPPSGDAGTGASDPALLEGGVISHHPGITGGDDLVPGIHGWTDPVAEVVITRID